MFLLIEYLCLLSYLLNQIVRYFIFVLLFFFDFLFINCILLLTIVIICHRALFFKVVFKLFWITFFVNVAEPTQCIVMHLFGVVGSRCFIITCTLLWYFVAVDFKVLIECLLPILIHLLGLSFIQHFLVLLPLLDVFVILVDLCV